MAATKTSATAMVVSSHMDPPLTKSPWDRAKAGEAFSRSDKDPSAKAVAASFPFFPRKLIGEVEEVEGDSGFP